MTSCSSLGSVSVRHSCRIHTRYKSQLPDLLLVFQVAERVAHERIQQMRDGDLLRIREPPQTLDLLNGITEYALAAWRIRVQMVV